MQTKLKKLLRPAAKQHTTIANKKEDSLLKLYRQQATLQQIQYDEHQVKVLQQLQQRLETLLFYSAGGRKKFFKTPQAACKSLYIYGGVGTGKSMLMDMFYSACPLQNKRRVHFHAFMREAHAFMHQWRMTHSGSPLTALAHYIARTSRLLCFDEFHVSDIADAMILGRLFRQLLDQGVCFIATSNRHPDELYRGGLQREQFLPFIKLLHEQVDIAEMTTTRDYRLGLIQAMKQSYFYPLNEDADHFLQRSYEEFTKGAGRCSGSLSVLGREIELSTVHHDIAWVSFEELCLRPLGAADYLELARKFNVLMIAEIPRFCPDNRNEVKRFVTLIDILYEHKVKLVCTAAVAPEDLYMHGDGAFEFLRTVSRLKEMQSRDYWTAEHNPG